MKFQYKYILVVITLLSIICVGCKHQIDDKQENYKISGFITGIDSGIVYLFQTNQGVKQILDSAIINKGSFEMSGSVDYPDLYDLGVNGLDKKIEVFLENSNISIELDDNEHRKVVISGSKAHNEYLTLSEKLSKILTNNARMRNQMRRAFSQNEMQKFGLLLDEYRLMRSEDLRVIHSLFQAHASSYVVPWISCSILPALLTSGELEDLMSSFQTTLVETPYYARLQEIIKYKKQRELEVKLREVGQLAPDFTLTTHEGKAVSLSSFKGKYVLIDFWASWCSPCRKEMPNVVEVYNKYKDQGFEVLGVSLDKDKEAWQKAIEAENIKWINVCVENAWNSDVVKLYQFSGVPHTVLVDKEGYIAAINVKGEALKKKLAEIFE